MTTEPQGTGLKLSGKQKHPEKPGDMGDKGHESWSDAPCQTGITINVHHVLCQASEALFLGNLGIGNLGLCSVLRTHAKLASVTEGNLCYAATLQDLGAESMGLRSPEPYPLSQAIHSPREGRNLQLDFLFLLGRVGLKKTVPERPAPLRNIIFILCWFLMTQWRCTSHTQTPILWHQSPQGSSLDPEPPLPFSL